MVRSGFSPEALHVLAKRPQKGATTDVVARRLIAGALDGDAKLSKEQLRQIRAKERCPPAPAMPTLLTESESEEAQQVAPVAPAKRRGREDSRPKEGTEWVAVPCGVARRSQVAIRVAAGCWPAPCVAWAARAGRSHRAWWACGTRSSPRKRGQLCKCRVVQGGGLKVFNAAEQEPLGPSESLRGEDNSHLRKVKNWAARPAWRQSPAFDIPAGGLRVSVSGAEVSEQYPDNQFPEGECVEPGRYGATRGFGPGILAPTPSARRQPRSGR